MNSQCHTGLDIVTTQVKHSNQLSDYYLRNHARFIPWHPQVSTDHHSESTWKRRLQEREIDFREGRAAHFISLENDRVVGTCSLTNILYSPAFSCNLGYSIDSKYEGTGAMKRIVKHVIAFGFENLSLNRICANYMPVNERSAHLLEKLGFEQEGFAKRYLYINGRWEDHILTSLLNPTGSVEP
jgi:ribosomal-protein-alanine N-acetyltransferase